MRKKLITVLFLSFHMFQAWGIDDCDIFRFICNYVYDSITCEKYDKILINSIIRYDCGPIAKDLMEFPCEFDNYFIVSNHNLEYPDGNETILKFGSYDKPKLRLFMPDIDDETVFIRVFIYWAYHYYWELYFKLDLKEEEIFIGSYDEIIHH